MTEKMPQMLRSDAQENRDRVLEAARELFAESGLDVTMREIARRAGVGPATLYRRFPTKRQLVVEAFMDELRACRAIVQEGIADPDPWRGLCSVIERITVLNAQNQGFTDAYMSTIPHEADFTAHRSEMLRAIAALVRRAKAAGALRADFEIDDIVLILMAGRGLATAPAASRTLAAHRFAALTIDALHLTDTNTPLPRKAPLLASVIAGRRHSS